MKSSKRFVGVVVVMGMVMGVVMGMVMGGARIGAVDDEARAPSIVPQAADDHGEGEHADEVRMLPEMLAKNGVKVAPAAKHVLRPTFVAPGRVAFNAERVAHVGSAVSGRVLEWKVRMGDVVRQGDALLVVDSPELGEAQNDYLLKRMQAEVAEPSVELAREAYERGKGLYDQTQGIAMSEVRRREGELQAAQGALRAARASVVAAENRLQLLGMDRKAISALAQTGSIDSKHVIRAPIDGEVIEREATLGELVGPDREALLVLADLRTLWVLAEVPEAKLEHVGIGCRAQIRVDNGNGAWIEGRIGYLWARVDPATRTVRARIDLTNGTSLPRPGMFAQVRIAALGGDSDHAVLSVPREAVQIVEGTPSVFIPVRGEDNTFAPAPVKVGEAIGDMVPVLGGLEEGDLVVVAGSFILKAELGKGSAGHEH